MSLADWRTLSVCCKIYVNGTNSHDDFCAEADSVCVCRVYLEYTNIIEDPKIYIKNYKYLYKIRNTLEIQYLRSKIFLNISNFDLPLIHGSKCDSRL